MAQTKTKRINVALPAETLRKLDKVTKRGSRSRFITEAIDHYVNEAGRTNLRAALKEETQERAQQNRDIAADWFHLEEEA